MNTDNKRGQNVALVGLVLQTALAAVYCTVWLLTGTVAAQGVFVLNAFGSAIWAMTAVIFYSRRLAELEAEEFEQLSSGDRATIFGAEGGAIPLAQRRLAMIRRIFSPAIALLLGAGLIALGAWLGRPLLQGMPETVEIDRGLMWAFFCLGSAFLGFLFSRYALGMAKDPAWRLLRAGGGFMTVGTLAGGLLCAAFFLNHLDITWALPLLPYVSIALMLLLGAEMLVQVVLDFYRPRKGDVEPRPSFDSRLANLISEPGGIAHSIADALNYQFGFEVSSTWFYELLRKTLVPLMLFGIVALVSVSSIVVVHPGRRAVVLTWGEAPASQEALSPGLYWKWPWPAQTADIIDVEQVRAFEIGVAHAEQGAQGAEDHGHGHDHRHGQPKRTAREKIDVPLVLWTVPHTHGGAEEINFLTAREPSGPSERRELTTDDPLTPTIPGHEHVLPAGAEAAGGAGAAPAEIDPETAESAASFGLVRMVFGVRYRVKDVYAFQYEIANAPGQLKQLALREATHFAARRDLDTIMESGGEGRIVSKLEASIAEAADQLGLGVEIVAVSLRGVHPPPKVADAFEEAIMAEQEQKGAELTAETTRDMILSTVAGSTRVAEDLDQSISRIHDLRQQGPDRQAIALAEEDAMNKLDDSGGAARALINQAWAERWTLETVERSRLAAFNAQMKAYKAAPDLYALEAKLRMLSEALTGAPRKYVLGLHKDLVELRYRDDRRVVSGGFSPTN
ncbi:MAG: SPFH domain-containing protein [Planctomycetota bacterium]